MPDIGIGLAPLGSSSLGYGSPTISNSTSALALLDQSGIKRNAVMIDTVTGDFVRDQTTGVHLGMDSVQQQVYLALRTLKGSSVVLNLGIAFKVKTISETTTQKLKAAVNEALLPLTSRALIAVTNVTAERVKMTAITVSVSWTNLTTGELNISRWTNG